MTISIIEKINDILKDSYTTEGVNRWWNRPRVELGGKTPNEALSSNPELVVSLAESINV